MSENTAEAGAAVHEAVNRFVARGFRFLGVARAEGVCPWRIVDAPESGPHRVG